MNATQLAADGWADALVAAVDADNEAIDTLCRDSVTLKVLRTAPAWAHHQVALAVADFMAAADRPLRELESTTVAHQFRVRGANGALNVIVGRLLVPNSPWPGHYGLEAVVFATRCTSNPSWFPPSSRSELVTLAKTVASSAAFARGHGTVIFPELLATLETPDEQGFGVVLVDRLDELYREHADTAARELGWPVRPPLDTLRLREIAFLAHEWGHQAVDAMFVEAAAQHRQRLLAVVGEIAADVAALDMLIRRPGDLPRRVAETLVMDRILREAWLPQPESRVGSIVGRHLIQLLWRAGAIRDEPGGLVLDLPAVASRIGAEREALVTCYRYGHAGDLEAVRDYLRSFGWCPDGNELSLTAPAPVLKPLGRATQG